MSTHVELVPMTAEECEAFIDAQIPIYAAEKVRSGNWPAEEAEARSTAVFRQLLPQGIATPDHYLYLVKDGTLTVGHLWIAIQRQEASHPVVWIYDVEILEAYRRRGYASACFAELEILVHQQLGLDTIQLHVFGHNSAAQALYHKLGYQITNIIMEKKLVDG